MSNILRVSDVNNYIKSLLLYDAHLNGIYVEGEISNFKRYSSGHAYFSLKDSGGVLKCVMFANQFRKVGFAPSDGMKVIAFGSVGLYERDGVYQLYVEQMRPDGIGALYEKYEQLKKQLQSEGLFDESHKKKIPLLPRTVAVVTSPSGAVIRDIMNVGNRRFPGMPLILYPASVQGAAAPGELIGALSEVLRDGEADVVIIGRGGGSIEDLWAFNDEKLARTIYDFPIPVISAVGHETDFTICDFVSDLRAPTPSAAAELAVPEIDALKYTVSEYGNKLNAALNSTIALKKREISKFKSGLGVNALRSLMEAKRNRLEKYGGAIDTSIRSRLKIESVRLEKNSRELYAFSYQSTLKRGYALVRDDTGNIIRNTKAFSEKGKGILVMSDGEIPIEPAE